MQDFDPQGSENGGGSSCVTSSVDSGAERKAQPRMSASDEVDMTEILKKVTVGDIVNARRIINGPSDKLRAVSAVKYPWVRPMWRTMIGNKWEADQVVVLRDKSEFKSLSKRQQNAFRRALAFLSNLDSIQCENLMMNVTPFITDPSIQQLLARQQLEEWIHVETYSTIIETIFEDPLEIYDMYRHNPLLSSKNDFITRQGSKVSLEPTPQNKVKAVVANMALEGVYFFNGFNTFFAINRASGKMNGSVDGIKYIQRDEKTHLSIFANIFNSMRAETPELFTKDLLEECTQILREAAQREAVWGKYVVDGGIPELNDAIMTEFPQFRAEECGKLIGLKVFPKIKNPIPWVDDYDGMTKANFFEAKPTSYSEAKPKFSRRTAGAS